MRERYLQAAAKRSRSPKPLEDGRIFAWSPNLVLVKWRHAAEKAGLNQRDPTTGRMKLHPHSLRKFFRSRGALVAPVDTLEILMGHRGGYLVEAYRRYDEQTLAEIYKKQIEPALQIYGQPENLEEIRKEQSKTSKIIEELVRENLELRRSLEELRRKVEALEAMKREVAALKQEIQALLKEGGG